MNQEIPVEQPKLELESTHSNIFDAVITHLKNKIKLKTTNDNLRFILDTMECYIIMHDTIYVLMKTYYSITNVKCELIIHSKNNLEKILNDIIFDYVSYILYNMSILFINIFYIFLAIHIELC